MERLSGSFHDFLILHVFCMLYNRFCDASVTESQPGIRGQAISLPLVLLHLPGPSHCSDPVEKSNKAFN